MADEPTADLPRGRVSLTLVLLRFLVCSFGFVVAALAAAMVGTFGLYRGLEAEAVYGVAFLGTVFLVTGAIAWFSVVPFAALVILMEAFALRSVILYAVAGGLVGGAFAFPELVDPRVLVDIRLHLATAAGVVGGFVYWVIAGRKAGAYRERIYLAPFSEPASPEA